MFSFVSLFQFFTEITPQNIWIFFFLWEVIGTLNYYTCFFVYMIHGTEHWRFAFSVKLFH